MLLLNFVKHKIRLIFPYATQEELLSFYFNNNNNYRYRVITRQNANPNDLLTMIKNVKKKTRVIKLKTTIYSVIYEIYDLLSFFARIGSRKAHHPSKLLIVRLDEIGDFMLWRPFLEELVTAHQFKDFTIEFCGNKIWKSLFETV